METFSHEKLYRANTVVSRPVVKHFQHQYHCWYQDDNVRRNRPRTTQDYLRQNSVVVKDLATHSPDMPPTQQMLHILGQPGRVWCGILTPSIFMIHVVRPQPQIQHIVGQIKEMAIGCGVLQPDIAIH